MYSFSDHHHQQDATFHFNKMQHFSIQFVQYLLINLIETIQSTFNEEMKNIFCWTDSQIVIQWLKKTSVSLKTFVANRVANIQTMSEKYEVKWNWIAGPQNPADLISRGSTILEILQENKWWKGPEWLKLSEKEWPEQPILSINDITEDKREFKTIHLSTMNETNELKKGKWFKTKGV